MLADSLADLPPVLLVAQLAGVPASVRSAAVAGEEGQGLGLAHFRQRFKGNLGNISLTPSGRFAVVLCT